MLVVHAVPSRSWPYRRNQLVHAARSFVQRPLSFVKNRRPTAVIGDYHVLLAQISPYAVGRLFDFSHCSLHLLRLPVEFLVHVGEVAVDLLKSFVQNRQRVQGLLRLSVQSPNFFICLRLALVCLLQAPFFPVEDFLELPEVFGAVFCGPV